MNRSVTRLVTAVAAHGLPGAVLEWPSRPLADDAWHAVLRGVERERLSGLLAEAVVAGALPATDDQIDAAAELHLRAMAAALRLDRRLLQAAAVLEGADVPFRVLKGAAVAHLAYADPAQRSYGDVDLLVSGDRFEAALAVLADAGYRRRWPQLRANFDRRFGKGTTLVAEGGWEIDLHRTFVMGPFGLTIDLEPLFHRASMFQLGDRVLPALAHEERFLHGCYAAALGDAQPRLTLLRDVAQHMLYQRLDIDRVRALARAWGGEAVVARAVTVAWQRLALADIVPLTVWAQRYEPDRAERRMLASYLDTGRYAAKAWASLRVIDGAAAKVAYLRAVALPDRAWLRRQERGRLRWVRQGGRALLERRA